MTAERWYCLGRPIDSMWRVWDAECDECARRVDLTQAIAAVECGGKVIAGSEQPYPCPLRRTWWAKEQTS